MPKQLSGIIPPILTPVDQSGRFDAGAMRDFVDWLIERGVDGLFVNGSTGEFTRFEDQTQHQIAETVVDAAAGRVPVVGGVHRTTAERGVEACRRLKDAGLVAAVVVSPIYFRLSQPGIAAYFAELARHSPLDLLLYNIPSMATEISVDNVVWLAKNFERIIGIKDSSGDVPRMMRTINAMADGRDDFCCFTGWDSLLTTMMGVGVDGGMVATANVLPEVLSRQYSLCRDSDWEAANRLQRMILPLFDAMLAVPEFPQGFRTAATSRGLAMGDVLAVLDDAARQENEAAAGAIATMTRDILQRYRDI